MLPWGEARPGPRPGRLLPCKEEKIPESQPGTAFDLTCEEPGHPRGLDSSAGDGESCRRLQPSCLGFSLSLTNHEVHGDQEAFELLSYCIFPATFYPSGTKQNTGI